ncbi:hypothetical protein [Rhodoblastus acidophilus]|uniref:hypothetical protein n=1 Tax=Rhodoblastus acidophilus TaxID=1074 RepID=UPI000B504C19|nr:hypothetical protein [Rhodoblastus acidophilus]PPQ39387.1 hypothetical protein CKO16_06430 [Rhodoblastus acidophilus]RAI19407.1 hypothetical protein CH337_12100 [Rhodoblastus acidophilus]
MGVSSPTWTALPGRSFFFLTPWEPHSGVNARAQLTFGDGLRGAKPLINLTRVEDAAFSPRARRFDA